MKKRLGFIVVAALAFLILSEKSSALVTDWVVDRYPSNDFSEVSFEGENAIKSTISSADYQANNWLNKQGYKKVVNNPSPTWYVSSKLYVSEEMISEDGVEKQRSTGLWLEIKDASNDIIGYPILAFNHHNMTAELSPSGFVTGWHYFNDTYGGYEKVNASNAIGWHTVEYSCSDGIVKFYIDGNLVRTKDYGEDVYLTGIMINTLNFNNNYSVYWDMPTQGVPTLNSVSLNNNSNITMNVGKTLQLTSTVDATPGIDKTITWISGNESIATVKNGLVTALREGTVTITARVGAIDKMVTIEVEKTVPVVANPNTADNIVSSCVMLGLSATGLGYMLLRKKRTI